MSAELYSLIDLIFSSTPALIRLTTHLLNDLREERHAQFVSNVSPATHDNRITLQTINSSPPGAKRKRSITHFEGIPLYAIQPPQTPRFLELAITERKVVYRKKLNGLDMAMKRLVMETGFDDSVEMGDESSCCSSCDSALADDEESSDDEDDVVVIL